MTNITIPDGVTSIDYYAFFYCINITGPLAFPSSLKTIGYNAFYGCGISSITIPNEITTIGSGAFGDCNNLTSITVQNTNSNYSSLDGVLFNKDQSTLIQYPNGKHGSYIIPSTVDSIAERSFQFSNGLTSISIPATVTTIESGAFSFCNSITSITIPSSVKSIGASAFIDCTKLTAIFVESGNLSYSSLDGVFFDKNHKTLIQYPNGKVGNSYNIPANVTSIGHAAFYFCSALTNITLPTTVTSIGTYAFYACDMLNNVTIPSAITTIGTFAFAYCRKLTSIDIPSSVLTIETNAFYYCSGLTSIYAYSTVPVNISASSSVFYNVDKTTCTLYVPTGTKSDYQEANQWKDFTNIVEFTTALPFVNEENISIYPNPVNDKFQIKGIKGTSELIITDFNGKVLLQKQIIGNENTSLKNLPAGIYTISLSNNGVNYQKKIIKK